MQPTFFFRISKNNDQKNQNITPYFTAEFSIKDVLSDVGFEKNMSAYDLQQHVKRCKTDQALQDRLARNADNIAKRIYYPNELWFILSVCSSETLSQILYSQQHVMLYRFCGIGNIRMLNVLLFFYSSKQMADALFASNHRILSEHLSKKNLDEELIRFLFGCCIKAAEINLSASLKIIKERLAEYLLDKFSQMSIAHSHSLPIMRLVVQSERNLIIKTIRKELNNETLNSLRNEYAAELFALVLMKSDQFFEYQDANDERVRFFKIAEKLPLEMQMVLCNRFYGLAKEIIPKSRFEPVVRAYANW